MLAQMPHFCALSDVIMIRFFLRSAPVAILLLAACHAPRKLGTMQHKMMDTITVSARNNPMEIYRATTPRIWDIVHSDVSLSFDFEKKEAAGIARLTIRPYAARPDTLKLDAKGMNIQSVYAIQIGSDEGHIPLPFSYDSVSLKIRPGAAFNMNSEANIVISYIAKPYASKLGGSAAITEDRGLYFINTDKKILRKPVQIWTQGETESNSHWLPTIDKPNQRTTTTIRLTVPDTMQTLSNGKLTTSNSLTGGMRQDVWEITQPIQVYAIMFAIGRFDKATESWRDSMGRMHDVRYYTEPQYAPYAKAMFANTPAMIETFSRTTGVQYPWDTYSQITVRDYVSGAMENTSASLFGEFTDKNFRQLSDASNEDVVSHELFHQWFGDYVTAESWSNLTLNESFATYGEQIWRRARRGAASADELAYSDLQRYLESTKRDDPPLVRFYYFDKEQMFDRVSYQKGGAILRYINGIIGDTLFNKSMRLYLTHNALHSAEATQWRLAIEEATGQDWTQFFNEWYYRGGHPVLRVHYAYDDEARKLRVTVRQNGSPDSLMKYTLPLKAEIITGKSHRLEDWLIKDRTQTFTYDYAGTARPLVIPDATHLLPGIIKEDKSPAQWLEMIRESDNYIARLLAVKAALAATSEPASLQIMQLAVQDKYAGIREAAFNGLAAIKKESWQPLLRDAVSYAVIQEGEPRVRAAAIRVANAWDMRNDIPVLQTAVGDSSYVVAGTALSTLAKMVPDTAYTLARGLLASRPLSELKYAVWNAIAAQGRTDDIVLFEEEAARTWGGQRVGLTPALAVYARAVKSDTAYGRAVSLLQRMAGEEENKSYRYAIGSTVFALRELYREEESKHTAKSTLAAARWRQTDAVARQILAAENDAEVAKQYKETEQE